MILEGLDCWDDYPVEHGCICGNECDPPVWVLGAWKKEQATEDFMGQPAMNPKFNHFNGRK